MEELKPCPVPWCVGNGVMDVLSTGFYSVVCNVCDVGIPVSCGTQQMAIERWNHRPTEDALRDRLEKAKKLNQSILSDMTTTEEECRETISALRADLRELAKINDKGKNWTIDDLKRVDAILAKHGEG